MAFDAGTIEATLDVRRNPFNEGLKKAQQDGRNFERQKFRATLTVESDTTAAKARLKELQQREDGRTINWNVDVNGQRLHRQLDDVVASTEKTAARSGNQIARLLLNPLVLQFGLLPGIAAGSAGAAALALAVVPAAFAAIAVAANKDSKALKDNWKNAWSSIKDDVQTITAPMVPYLAGIATKTERAFKNIEPTLAGVFKTAGPQVDLLADGLLNMAQRIMPGLSIATINSGKAIEGVNALMGHLADGVSELFTEISYSSANAGQGAEVLGRILEKVLQTVGVLIAQFSGSWAQIGPQFASVFNQLLDTITQVTAGGLTGFNTTLQVTLSVLQVVMSIIQPFAGALGVMGGSLLGVIAGWKLLTGGVTLAAKAFDLIRPASIAARLVPLTAGLNNLGVGLGIVTGKIGSNADAADKWTAKVAKFSGVVTKAASALPILGAAIIGVVEASNYFFPSADDLATQIMKGGTAATEARKKISDYADSTTLGGAAVHAFGTSLADVNKKIQETRSNMTPLERAQMDATAAQNHLTEMTKQYGQYSGQAKDAQILFANATDRVADAQKAAADATKTHTDRIVEQTNLLLGEVGARLNYQASLVQLEQSQKALTDAVKAHGASSIEARDADIAYQQQLIATVQAVGQRAKAEADAKGVTDSDAYATAAMTQEIVRLAEAAGNNAPPALRQMINGLDDSALAAIGVHREVDGAGNSVYRLPDGKTLTFPNDANQARSQVQDLHAAIDNVPTTHYTKFFQEVFRTVNVIDPGGVLPLGDTGQRASGGWITGPGGPTEDNLLYLLSNGEYVVNAKDAGIFAKVLEYINSGAARKSIGRAGGGWGGSGPVVNGSVPQNTWDQLLAAGWRGNPKDGMEALYPPAASAAAQQTSSGGSGRGAVSTVQRGGNTYIFYVTSHKADPVEVASEVSNTAAWASRGAI